MSDWSKITIGSISTLRKGISYKSEEYCDEEFGNPFITIKCFVKGGGYEPYGLKYLDGVFTKLDELVAGDILFSATDLTRAGDIVGSPLRVPNFGEDCIAIASTDCMKIDFNTKLCDKDFMYHRMMLSDIRQKMVAYSAGSTVLHLDTKQVLKFTICIPKQVATQKKIARILDTIDRTITHTEALIEKYQQMKAGLMHDLFTRGIGADGKLRPPRDKAPELYQESSIGWIPKEWKVKPLAEITSKIVDGVHHTPKYVEHGVPFVTVKNLTGSTTIDFTNLNYIDEKTHYECYSRADPKPGDVLVTKDGTLGTCRIVREGMPEFSIFVSVALLRVTDELTAEWLHFFFDSGVYLRQLGYLSSGTGLKHIHLEHFRKFQITLPDKFEQEQINKKVQIAENKLVSERKILSKLIQQKSGLMHDLLTGTVQVNSDPV